jgi:hypothetical protein
MKEDDEEETEEKYKFLVQTYDFPSRCNAAAVEKDKNPKRNERT